MPQLEWTVVVQWAGKIVVPALAMTVLLAGVPGQQAPPRPTMFDRGAPIVVGTTTISIGASDCDTGETSTCAVAFTATNNGDRPTIPQVADFTLRGADPVQIGVGASTTLVRAVGPGETTTFAVTFRKSEAMRATAVRFVDLDSQRALTVRIDG